MGPLVVAVDAVDPVVLPVLGTEQGDVGRQLTGFGLAGFAVTEVCAERATPLIQIGGILRQDSLAALAEQTRPVRRQELALEAPGGVTVVDHDVAGVVGPGRHQR